MVVPEFISLIFCSLLRVFLHVTGYYFYFGQLKQVLIRSLSSNSLASNSLSLIERGTNDGSPYASTGKIFCYCCKKVKQISKHAKKSGTIKSAEPFC